MHISGNKVQEEKTLLNLFQIGEPDFFIVNYFTEKDHYSSFNILPVNSILPTLYLEPSST
jgi:outer membrane protein insertion porin family